MANFKLTIAYDGGPYHGWQEVGMGPTIEGTLQQVLEQLLQTSTPLQAASRTDAGVHATGQVVNFLSNKTVRQSSINALLPPDIRVLALEEVEDDFHPTMEATSKEYHYHLCLGSVQSPQHRHTSWHCSKLNIGAMEEATHHLVGRRDFGALANSCKEEKADTVRTLHKCALHPLPENRLKIVLCADAFLYRMARNLVGMLVQVGWGQLSPSLIPSILLNGDRRLAGVCAPAHGLCLANVEYPTRRE